MCDAIVHRGPDDCGYFVGPGIALGMRRLSIIDVAGGQQPIGNEDGSIQVVFNGEIYNHHDLRRGLVARGHRFRTKSDTETIVHLYEEMGADCVTRLRGMFAIALWDARTKRLVLARDRLGIKPLSYWLTPDGIAFCSELRSLLALSRFPGRLDERGIAAFLSLGYVPDPLAAFAGVAKLPPGHVLVWSATGGAETRRYWTPVVPETGVVDEAVAAERLRELLAWGRPLFRLVGRALPHVMPGRGRLLDRARPREAAYAGTVSLPLAPVDGGMAAHRLVPRDGEFGDLLADAFAAAHARDFVSQMTLVDVATYLPGDILTKVDRVSMAVSLEARVPLLDHPLVEVALGLPADLKIRHGTGQRVFRRAIRRLVPPEVLDHPKLGFAVPLGPLFRGPLGHRS